MKANTKQKAKANAHRKVYAAKNPERMLLLEARKRAKRKNVPCNLTLQDIVIPVFCPVLGIELKVMGGENSPSLDRIRPSLGYVKGNIAIMSTRANRIKNDATLEEVERLMTWMRRVA